MMSKGSFTMQKSWTIFSLPAGLSPFDTGIPPALSLVVYGSPIRRRVHVLLLPDAGVWVRGSNEILPTHPAKAGGF